ncbi:hypothetical protein [Streptosporangium minutum]|uniref:Uncharacterized protein n=1 Tax=Streptosporangium minutum TaxID=569862 RepID=A0A243RQ06_9ACTN|nr:hypothetical protein [Streptosporangium minutum]OUC97052.1 hypothetical protein CA984_12595 [Streptosporangium minutum]
MSVSVSWKVVAEGPDSIAGLFWALRGGGDFSLVAAIEFDLHPAPALYGGRPLWPAEVPAGSRGTGSGVVQ